MATDDQDERVLALADEIRQRIEKQVSGDKSQPDLSALDARLGRIDRALDFVKGQVPVLDRRIQRIEDEAIAAPRDRRARSHSSTT